VTGAGTLPCKKVIHAVGPIWSDMIPKERNVALLHSAVLNTLITANKIKCRSVAIPAISSGIFGFPKPLCATTFFQAIEAFFVNDLQSEDALTEIHLTNFDFETTDIFRKEFSAYFSAPTKKSDEAKLKP
jgi:putative ATPase